MGANWEAWTGPAPMRPYNAMIHPRGWRSFKEYGNGILGDMCIHMLDMVRWMLGLGWPRRIASTGGILVDKGSKANVPDTQTATFDFGDLDIVWEHRTWGQEADPNYPWGATIYGDKGTLKLSVYSYDFIPLGGGTPIHKDVVYELEQYPEDKTEKDLERHVAPAIRRHMLDFVAAIQSRGKPVADIYAVVADPYEARGKHVHKKSADELDRVERHGPLASSLGVVLPAEGNLAILQTEQATVADGRLVRVSSQVLQDSRGSSPWWLGRHDPVGSHGLRQQMVELSGVGQRGELAREAKLPPSEGSVQSRQKLTPEHATKDAFGQEKVVGADDPVALVQRQSAPRHDAMDVRMEVEFLPPGVERHEHTDLGPQVFGISGQLNQGFRGSLHQQAVNSAGIVKGDRAEITGKREDNHGSKARAANRRLEPPAIGPRRWPGTWGNGDCHRSYRRSADARIAGTPGRAHPGPPCGTLPDRQGFAVARA